MNSRTPAARGVAVYATLNAIAVRVMVAVRRSGGVTIAGASETAASPASSLLLLTLQ
jgi:hypothetical protein